VFPKDAGIFASASASKTHLGDGEFLKVKENMRVPEVTRKNPNTNNIQNMGQHFKLD